MPDEETFTWTCTEDCCAPAAPDRPGDRDQQQAGPTWLDHPDHDVIADVLRGVPYRCLRPTGERVAAALAAARAEEAARWQAKIRQAQAEALEAAADAYESDDEQPHINRMADEVYRPGDNLSSLWLRDRAAALRVSASGTDQPLGDQTTPAGVSGPATRSGLSSERNEERD